MKKVVFYLTFSILLLSTWNVSAQTCEEWVPIAEESYNVTFTDINDPNANTYRPLGFKMSSYIFEGAEHCVEVKSTDGNGRHIQLAVELRDSGTLQVKNNRNSVVIDINDSANKCNTVPAAASSVQYRFYCNGAGCESGEKFFWYRFVVEKPDENGQYEENWCDTLSSDTPSSLISIPSVLTPPPEKPDVDDGAAGVKIAFEIILLTFFTLIVILF